MDPQQKEQAAEKLLSARFGKRAKHVEAAELLETVGKLYRAKNEPLRSGKAFLRAAEVRKGLDDILSAAGLFVEAGNAFGQENSTDACKALLAGISLYLSGGYTNHAAKAEQFYAEYLERQGSVDEAVEAFSVASSYHFETGNIGKWIDCVVSEGRLQAGRKQFARAAKLFETVAQAALEPQNHLLRYGVPENWLRAFLCAGCADQGNLEGIEQRIAMYTEIDPGLEGARQKFLMDSICCAIRDRNEEVMDDAVDAYIVISPLDSWEKKVVAHIRQFIY